MASYVALARSTSSNSMSDSERLWHVSNAIEANLKFLSRSANSFDRNILARECRARVTPSVNGPKENAFPKYQIKTQERKTKSQMVETNVHCQIVILTSLVSFKIRRSRFFAHINDVGAGGR